MVYDAVYTPKISGKHRGKYYKKKYIINKIKCRFFNITGFKP